MYSILIAQIFFLGLFNLILSESVTNLTPVKPLGVTSEHEFPYLLYEEEIKTLNFNISFEPEVHSLMVAIASSNTEIAKVVNDVVFIVPNKFNFPNISVDILGVFLGRTNLQFYVNQSILDQSRHVDDFHVGVNTSSDVRWHLLNEEYEITVSRHETALNTAFIVCVVILVALVNVAMGCKTDLQVIKTTLKKPIAPLTGLTSQFVLMPVISFGLGRLMEFDPAMSFGLFALGCSPGGSASNMYTYLLGGDVSLSITMTFCSVLLSLAMVPLWLFTLGAMVIYRDTEVHIPFENIVSSLFGLIIPVGIGILLQKKKPNWAKFCTKAVKPLLVIFLVFVFTVGVYANLFIFSLMTPKVLIAGFLVTILGLLFGGFVAFLARQSWKNIKTISIETGIQNTGIAIVLLQLSLPPPDSDISIVAPIIGAIFTPVPLVTAILVRGAYIKWFKKEKSADSEEETKDEKKLDDAFTSKKESGLPISYKHITEDTDTEKDVTDT